MAAAKKQKILYLMRMLLNETDENHTLTMKEILKEQQK